MKLWNKKVPTLQKKLIKGTILDVIRGKNPPIYKGERYEKS